MSQIFVGWLIALQIPFFVFSLQPSLGQVPIDPLDPRVVFDPKNRDATRIPGIINRIDESQRQLDVQIGELDRVKNDTQNLQAQYRSLTFSRREIVIPPHLTAGLQKAADLSAKITFLAENVSELEKLSAPIQSLNQDISRLRSPIPATRRLPSAQSNSVIADLSARLSRQLDDVGTQCELEEVAGVLKKPRDDPNRFDDVSFNDDADILKTVTNCFETITKRADLNAIRNSIVAEIQTFVAELSTRIDRLRSTLATMQDTKEKWQGQLRRATEISNSLIDWTIPLLAISVIALLAIPALYNLEVQKIVLSNGIILEVFTVFLLITTVLLLGIADRIQSEALGTLLGGISGYVLGRSTQRSKNDDSGVPKSREALPVADPAKP